MRSYCVGLPVVITVHDDGVITYEIDVGEAPSAIWEDEGVDFTDDQRHADQAAISADVDDMNTRGEFRGARVGRHA